MQHNVRVALVTGASKGLGRTIAGFLADDGYDLVVTARDQRALEAAAGELQARGGEVVAIAGDVSDHGHRVQLRDAAADLGRLDLVVNNASELGPSPMPALSAYPTAALSRVFEVNVIAPIALAQLVLPLLSANRGMLVNITSDAAVGAYPGWGGYGGSKAALDLMTRTLATELEAEAPGVTVVAVDPGDLRTDMHQAAFPGEDISDRPEPAVTVPFWAWLLGREHDEVNGRRFEAQSEAFLVTETDDATAAAP